MSTHITSERMSSDLTKHHASRSDSGTWEVSWLPGRELTHGQAVTAMALAEAVAVVVDAGGPVCTDTVWTLIDAWAAELGLTGPDAATRVTQP